MVLESIPAAILFFRCPHKFPNYSISGLDFIRRYATSHPHTPYIATIVAPPLPQDTAHRRRPAEKVSIHYGLSPFPSSENRNIYLKKDVGFGIQHPAYRQFSPFDASRLLCCHD